MMNTPTFDSVRYSVFRDGRNGHMLIVRPRFDEAEQTDWVEVCGEVVWRKTDAGNTYVGMEMYYDDGKKVAGFSDTVKVLRLPAKRLGTEVDLGIAQLMRQNVESFNALGFNIDPYGDDLIYMDIHWPKYFGKAGYQVIRASRS